MRGQGKPGFCSICASPLAASINKLLAEGANARQVRDFVASAGVTPWSRPTMYNHRDHAMGPEKRVVQIAEQQRKALAIRKSSNTEFLEAVRDIGMAKAESNPEEISIDQAMKAAQILESRKERNDNFALLVAFVTGNKPAGVIIEGEATEVPQ